LRSIDRNRGEGSKWRFAAHCRAANDIAPRVSARRSGKQPEAATALVRAALADPRGPPFFKSRAVRRKMGELDAPQARLEMFGV